MSLADGKLSFGARAKEVRIGSTAAALVYGLCPGFPSRRNGFESRGPLQLSCELQPSGFPCMLFFAQCFQRFQPGGAKRRNYARHQSNGSQQQAYGGEGE